jgi:HK97 family phage portal protein
LGAVFRAVQVLTTAGGQLSLDSYQRTTGQVVPVQPSIVRKPDTAISRSEWIQTAIMNLALNGNLFVRKNTGPDGSILTAEVLPAHEVQVYKDDRGRIRYGYKGDEYTPTQIVHAKFVPVPGRKRGLGPIEAGTPELRGAMDLRDYTSNIFRDDDVPSGVLSTDQQLNGEDAQEYKTRWVDTADGKVRVLGHGLNYTPIIMTPKVAQYVETRQLTVLDVARLLGVPASLMLAAVEGSGMTYQNVEQEWIGFTRFTLMAYLKPIEDLLTDLVPGTQEVRFNVEALLRSDTKTRYETYKLALDGGWMHPDEPRDIEHMPPRTDLPAPKETHVNETA